MGRQACVTATWNATGTQRCEPDLLRNYKGMFGASKRLFSMLTSCCRYSTPSLNRWELLVDDLVPLTTSLDLKLITCSISTLIMPVQQCRYDQLLRGQLHTRGNDRYHLHPHHLQSGRGHPRSRTTHRRLLLLFSTSALEPLPLVS